MPWAPWEPNGSEQGDNCIRLFIRPEEDTHRFVAELKQEKITILEGNGMTHIVATQTFRDQFVKRIKQLTRNRWNEITGHHLVAAQAG